MKEDHVVAGVLMLLIAALVLGALYESDSNGITGGATSIPFVEGTVGTVVLAIVILLAFGAATFGIYRLYFKGRLAKKRSASSGLTQNFTPSNMGMISSEHIDHDANNLKSYVSNQRAKGESDDSIRAKLVAVGWNQDSISKAFR